VEVIISLTGFFSRIYYWFLDHFYESYTRRILIEAIQLLGKLWPYLLFGILLTTLIKMYISRDRIALFFKEKAGSVSIILAALIGVVSPLGSYVVIPLSAALFAIGVPLPPLMALMIASPLIDPNLFLLTSGAMGLEMAVMRSISALLLGIMAGYATRLILLYRRNWFGSVLRDNGEFTIARFTEHVQERTFRAFLKELYKMTKYISKYFFLAIVLAAAIKILVNPNVILRAFSANNLLSVLFTTAAGVPFYVCGGAAIPVVQSLAEIGLSKGAALAFFISGPVTKISNLVLLSAAFKSRVLVIYLVMGIGGAVLFGLLYSLVT